MDHYKLKDAMLAHAKAIEMPISAFSMLVLLESQCEFELRGKLARAPFWVQPLKKEILLKPVKPNAFELNPLLLAWLTAEDFFDKESVTPPASPLRALISKFNLKGATGLTAVLWEDSLMDFLDQYAAEINKTPSEALLELAQAYLEKASKSNQRL